MLFRYAICSAVRVFPTSSSGRPVAEAERLSANPYPEQTKISSLFTLASFRIAKFVAKRSSPANLLTVKFPSSLVLTTSGTTSDSPSK